MASFLGLMAFCSFICLWTALGYGRLAWVEGQRARVLDRFRGYGKVHGPIAAGNDPVVLLRDEAPKGWRRYLPRAPAGERRAVPLYFTILLFFGVSVTMTLGFQRFALNPVFGALLGLVLSACLWLFQARQRAKRRAAQIEEALPEAMDLIVRALRVGVPVSGTLQAAGSELIGPIAHEFRDAAERIQYGQDLVPALRDMAERSNSQGLRFFAAAVAIQINTGGNLAEVLERLAAIARARQQLRRKINSITAEAKWSGRFLSAFPLLAVAMLLSINPDYFAEIAEKSFFYPMIAVVGFLLLMNVIFMRWLIKIE